MFNMGSSCSMPRQDGSFRRRNKTSGRLADRTKCGTRSTLRHSVVCAIPDGSIADLYPVEDNYVNVQGNLRSPKTLAELCVDAVCRSLPYLDGELPQGLPHDVVDDVITSLIQHSALTATTLRVLRNCEFDTLSLVNCRGVTDAWFEPFLVHQPSHSSYNRDRRTSNGSEELHQDNSTPFDATMFHSTSSQGLSPSTSDANVKEDDEDEGILDIMDLDMDVDNDDDDEEKDTKPTSDIFYSPFDPQALDDDEEENVSTTSFSSAHDDNDGLSHPMDIRDELFFPEATTTADHYRSTPTIVSSVTSNLTLLDIRGSQGLTDRGLLQLTHLSNLKVAKLDQCHSLTGRGLLAFSHSLRLHTLSLANCRRLTDEAVINIAHLTALQALSLDGCRCLTDRSLAAISDLHNLVKLDLSQCDLITDHGLDELQNLHSLQELSLGWCRQITDVGLGHFVAHTGRDTTLRVLRLARCSITDQGVVHLARLQALEELDLNGCSGIKSAALGETLGKLSRLTVLDVSHCPDILRAGWQGKINALKSLELCYSSVKDTHILKFMNLSTLEELNLDSCPLGDRAIAHLADHDVVPNLTSLDLADTNLSDLGMAKIAMFKKLTRLSLFYCNISNSGLRHIASLVELQVLNLDSREISDEGLSHLRSLTKLKSLDIFSGRITDSGCVHISKIRSLESLELCGGSIGDNGCSVLATLDNLVSLNLSQNERITNRGAAALATLSNLKALNLSNTLVNSAALRFFSGLLKLQSLALYGCRGIDDTNMLGRLQNGLPNLKCLRLNTSSAEDGMVVAADESDDDDDDLGSLLAGMSPRGERTIINDETSYYSDHD